jgi:hypothetical protein
MLSREGRKGPLSAQRESRSKIFCKDKGYKLLFLVSLATLAVLCVLCARLLRFIESKAQEPVSFRAKVAKYRQGRKEIQDPRFLVKTKAISFYCWFPWRPSLNSAYFWRAKLLASVLTA